MGAHRYWRVKIDQFTDYLSVSEFDLYQIYFYDSFNTDTRATDAYGGTAIAGESYSAGYLPANAFDGSTGNLWATTGNTATYADKWIGWDFGSGNAYEIKQWGIAPYSSSNTPVIFALEYSDNGTSWTRVQTITKVSHSDWGGVTFAKGGGVSTFPYSDEMYTSYPVTTGSGHRFWRFKLTGVPISSEVDIAQVNFQLSGTTLHFYSTPTFAGSAYGASYLPRHATQKVNSSGGLPFIFKNSDLTAGDAWLAFDFGGKVAPDNLNIVWLNYVYIPTGMIIEYSDDGTSWTTSDTYVPTNPGSGGNISQNFGVTSGGGGGGGGGTAIQMVVVAC
jgi:hypothetical protein